MFETKYEKVSNSLIAPYLEQHRAKIICRFKGGRLRVYTTCKPSDGVRKYRLFWRLKRNRSILRND